MKKTTALILILSSLVGSLLLQGCATKGQRAALYDFGTMQNTGSEQALPALPPISIAEIQAPAWLDNTHMFFRLNYANEQQPRPYAYSRWTMPPAQLFSQRIKSRLAQAGGAVLPTTAGIVNTPVLRLEADNFMQLFESAEKSTVRIELRATVSQGSRFIGQKSFIKQLLAPTADASGEAAAMSLASDAAIEDIAAWLATLPLTSR